MEHEELVSVVADNLRSEGYKVLLIKKPIPDIIAISGDNVKTVACEISSSNQPSRPYKKKLKYMKYGFDTDDLLIITNRILVENETPPEAYYLAIKLIKKGVKYKVIVDMLKDKFDVDVAQSTLSVWKKGKTKPYSVRDLEGVHTSKYI